MKKEMRERDITGAPIGGRSPEGGAPVAEGNGGQIRSGFDPGAVRRWSPQRKQEVVLRILRGEPVDELSRELGVEIYRLEEWRRKALLGMETALRERSGDPLNTELEQAMKRIGELTMENELLRMRCEKKVPQTRRRLK